MGGVRAGGAKSRDILKEIVVDADPATVLGNKRFPWLSYRNIELGMVPVRAIRVAYTGELGWELHHPDRDAAEPVGPAAEGGREARDEAGGRAGAELAAAGEILPRLRQRAWPRRDPAGSRVGPFVDLSKDFQGKDAMLATGIRSKCCTLLIDGPSDTDPWGKEAIIKDGQKVGRLTSGGYSVAFGKQIGMGYVSPELAVPGTKTAGAHPAQLWDAVVTEDSPFDPSNARIRVDG